MNKFFVVCVWVVLFVAQAACAVRLPPAPPPARQLPQPALLSGPMLIEAMQRGGLVIYFRHAVTDRSQHEGTIEDLANCEHQRNLSGRGVDDATKIGAAFRALRIPVGKVLSSGFCRTRDTAKIAFERVDEIVPDITGFPVEEQERRTQTLRRLLATQPVTNTKNTKNTNTVIVGHGANIASVVIGLSLQEGEAAIFRPTGDSFALIGRIRPAQWQELMRASTPSTYAVNASVPPVLPVLSPLYKTDKKLIEYGWDMPAAEFARDNIATMEQQPFDGVTLKLPGGDPTLAFDAQPWTRADVKLDALSAIRWKRFTDNFIAVWGFSKQDMDWFGDARWATITANTQLLSQAVQACRCKGITFDPEFYFRGQTFDPWNYRALPTDVTTRYSFVQVEEKVRQRGAQYMQALQHHAPEVRVIVLHAWHTLANDYLNRKNLEASAGSYSLVAAFLGGMLSATNPNSVVIDGQETAYYYENSRDYIRSYDQIHNQTAWLMDDSTRAQFDKNAQAGVAVSMDYPLGNWPQLGKWPIYAKHKIPRAFRLQWLKHNLYHALLSTDEYVWLYGEGVEWWRPDGRDHPNENTGQTERVFVPEGVADVVREVRSLIAQRQPLGYGMHYIDPRQPAMKNAVTVTLVIAPQPITLRTGQPITLNVSTHGSPVADVELFADSIAVGKRVAAPFSFELILPKGKHLLFARASHVGGHNTSNIVYVEVQ